MRRVKPRPGRHNHQGKWSSRYSNRSTSVREPQAEQSTVTGPRMRAGPRTGRGEAWSRKLSGVLLAVLANSGCRADALSTESAAENSACFPRTLGAGGRRGSSSTRSAGAQNRALFPRGSRESDMTTGTLRSARRAHRALNHVNRSVGPNPGMPGPRARTVRAGGCYGLAREPLRNGSTFAPAARVPALRIVLSRLRAPHVRDECGRRTWWL